MVLSVGAALLAMGLIWRMASTPDMALLYAGLEPAAAGEVVAALEQQQTPYEVRGNAIYVPSDLRDNSRLGLAAEGLPATGGVGYELLDAMTGFGTTAQMFDAAYWRAKEGELARTILASREVRAARVHLAATPRSPFAQAAPVTASVSITPATGALAPALADAIRHMVASAVSGLSPNEVTVIDSVNGVVMSGGENQQNLGLQGQGDSRAQQMQADLERLLSARVGEGNARVQVNIDADMDSQTITERVIDPASRVAISSELEERTEESQGTAGGDVTVASNLPAGDAEGAAGGSTSATSETRERQNFEVSETRRERIILPGQIRRISVAVIVDGIAEISEDGSRTWQPRPEEEMTALRTLVEAAIGFDPARGDVVTLQTLEFPSPTIAGTEAADGGGGFLTGNIINLIQTVVLGVVALALGLFVVRPLLTQPPALPAPEGLMRDAQTIDLAPEDIAAADAAVAQISASEVDADANKVKNLRDLVSDRRDEAELVLRRWIDAPETAEVKS